MDFAADGHLLRDRRLRRALGVGSVARFPNAVAGIILTLHVAVTIGEGYGAAGLAVAAMTLGKVVGPLVRAAGGPEEIVAVFADIALDPEADPEWFVTPTGGFAPVPMVPMPAR